MYVYIPNMCDLYGIVSCSFLITISQYHIIINIQIKDKDIILYVDLFFFRIEYIARGRNMQSIG